ncbi:TonB-dependent receptor [Escherichia coli]|nr:TonB-dependent receptor [Escherichia coli]
MLNSTLSWQAREDVCRCKRRPSPGTASSSRRSTTIKVSQWLTGNQKNEVSPYSIVGLSATWDVTKNVSLTGGVDNLFDKRLWRAGNAQTTGDGRGQLYRRCRGVYL